MTEEFSDLLPIFLEEARENIEKSHKVLSELEQGKNKQANINDIARFVHTIKGSCASFGFNNTGVIAHNLENKLQDLKSNPDLATAEILADVRMQIDKIDDLIRNNDSTEPNSKPETLSAIDDSIRVPINLINSSLNNIWEIFLIKNQISYLFQSGGSEPALKDLRQSWETLDTTLGRNIAELENRLMQMRMTNLSRLFSRMEKIVRNYAQEHPEKKIRFETSGEDIEVDKKVSDMLNEPLVHLIRNAMDHGLEDIQSRQDAGKAEFGVIQLRAQAGVDTIDIIVTDDGGGIDHQKIAQKAFEKGLINTIDIDKKSAVDLIFTPGFSTADQITNTSGRGVGMDSVKQSIVEIGGRVSLTTEVGKGSQFKVTLPISLSVISAVILEVNNQIFGGNTNNVVEIVKAPHSYLKNHGEETLFNFRDSFIPCVDLGQVLSKYDANSQDDPNQADELSVIVVGDQTELVAIRVDKFRDNSELIVKPVPGIVNTPRFVDGMSILPTGEPIFILSFARLVEQSPLGQRGLHAS